MLLPARTAVLAHLYREEIADMRTVMAALKSQYGHEKQFSEAMYLEHLMALEANGMAELHSHELDDKGELVLNFKITDDGRSTVEKYVSKAYL
jgi:hypothetical protein